MSGVRLVRVIDPLLRQTAFSIEQMAPGGIDRPECGAVRAPDLERAQGRLSELIQRPGHRDGTKQNAIQLVLERTHKLVEMMNAEGATALVYLDDAEYGLQPRLRSAAIEIDFCFGDKDGKVGPEDIKEARKHYGSVRGPVGWNRLLLTDEIERRLFPERTLRSTEGLRLLPEDWLCGPPDPIARLRKVCRYLDDSALARTYADIAARLALWPSPTQAAHALMNDALTAGGGDNVTVLVVDAG